MTPKPILMAEGDTGVVMHPDGTVDLLISVEEEGRPLTQTQAALLGAAIGILSDEDFVRLCLQTISVYNDAHPGSNGGH